MNKYLEKVAGLTQVKRLVKRHLLRNQHTYKYGGTGAVIGSLQGLTPGDYMYENGKFGYHKYTPEEKKTRAIVGAATLGITGGLLGKSIDRSRINRKALKRHYARQDAEYNKTRREWEERFRQKYSDPFGSGSKNRYGNGSSNSYGSSGRKAGNERATDGIHQIHKDLGKPEGFKTKAEATAHFRKMRSQYHPDKHPGKEAEMNAKMANLNRAWDQFQKHADGFEKLANAYLLKAASVDLNKIKTLVKNNPLPVVGGAALGGEAFLSTTKQKNESSARYHLRQVRNTVGGVGAGVVAGKVIQEGYKQIQKD